MRRGYVLTVATVATATVATAGWGVIAAAPARGQASPVTGITTLAGPVSPAAPGALSCAAPGDCVVGGAYTEASGGSQAFVATEKDGAWGAAIDVPGMAAMNRGAAAAVTSVSCSAPGDCTAVGRYSPGGTAAGASGLPDTEAFVVTERGGVWGVAVPLPGLAAMNKGDSAAADTVSCWAPGDCAVAGTYAAGLRGRDLMVQAFVATETDGVWGLAAPLPGLTALNTAGQADISALSCAPARGELGLVGITGGDCVVGGQYGSAAGTEAFLARETDGAWHPAREFPGTAARNTAGAAAVDSISCPAAGECAATGSYAYKTPDGAEAGTGFVADSRGGVWGAPHPVPGTGDVVSCGAPGDCAAGGTYMRDGHSDAFVVNEKRGAWGSPRPVPGLAGLDSGRDAALTAISCPAVGDCAVGGSYASADSGNSGRPFVVTETGGAWSAARSVQGGAGSAAVTLISCVPQLACTAVGYDDSGSGGFALSIAPP